MHDGIFSFVVRHIDDLCKGINATIFAVMFHLRYVFFCDVPRGHYFDAAVCKWNSGPWDYECF